MTLRYVEGFDYIPASSGSMDRLLTAAGYFFSRDQFGGTPSIGNTGRFDFGRCLLISGFTNVGSGGYRVVRPIDQISGTVYPEGVFGFALYVPSPGLQAFFQYVGLYDAVSDAPQITLHIGNNGVFRIYRGYPNGGTLLITSHAAAFLENEWQYVEIRTNINNVGGTVEVRVNTRMIISLVAADTQNTAVVGFDSIVFGCQSQGGTGGSFNFYLDDMYVLDTTGSVNNNFLGNVRVFTQFPSGPNHTSFSKFGPAATNWQAASNGNLDDTSYVYSPTTGDFDLYTLQAVVNGPVVYGVQLRGAYRQDDATQRIAHNRLKAGTTSLDGVDHYLNQTYTYYTDIIEQNPDTGVGWTGTEVNALLAGPKVQS